MKELAEQYKKLLGKEVPKRYAKDREWILNQINGYVPADTEIKESVSPCADTGRIPLLDANGNPKKDAQGNIRYK